MICTFIIINDLNVFDLNSDDCFASSFADRIGNVLLDFSSQFYRLQYNKFFAEIRLKFVKLANTQRNVRYCFFATATAS